MSLPNQHQTSLTISQNEDNKQPKIEINCSSQSIHQNSIELLKSNKLDESFDLNVVNKSDEIDQIIKDKEQIDTEQLDNEQVNIEQSDNEQINTVQIDNEHIDKIDYNEKIINNEEIVISTINTDEQVIQCEIAFNSQDEQLENSTVLIIDESKNQLIKTDELSDNQIENNKLSITNTENSDLNLNKLESKTETNLVNELENKSCTTLNQQQNQLTNEKNQVKSLNKLSEDYLLNSSTITNNKIINNKPTLNHQHIQLNQFNSAANKRKLTTADLPQQLLQFVTSRKSARLHESQSYHSDNSTYLFESLRKCSSSISSTNSLNSDLARSTAKSTNEIHLKSVSASNNSASIKLSKRRCANLDDPVMDDCTAALVLMSLSYSPKSALLKDKIKKLIKKEVSTERQMPIRSPNRIAMLPKERFKQEQRLRLLNSNTYQSKTKPNSTNKSNSSSKSIEEGFNEEFVSYSDEDDELLILQQDVKLNDNLKPLSVKKQTKSSSPDKMKCNTILKPTTRMVFQCTWRNCGHECDVREEIEEHVRIKHLGITSVTDDHEEDFYYTEVELDSPLDSSGVSSASNVSPLHEPTNNNNMSTQINTSITQFTNQAILKQARKRGPKPRQKNIVIDSSNNLNKFNSTVWMHMDMARPPHEDPEYKSRLLNSDNNNTNIIAKRERKRAASNDYASDQSDLELNRQQQQQHQYIQNLTREQLVKLQQQNDLHLKNNIQHLQQLQRQHHQLHQLHQLHQYNQLKRKYTKSQPSITNSSSNSILMPTTRTKSVICNMAQIENDLDHRLLNSTNQHSSNLLKRSKPIKIPGISLAHRDYHQNPNPSPSFTVGSVQLSPTSYFHCFSPTPPHSLSSPTSSNSSMYSLGSCNSPGSSSIASSSSTGGSLNSYSPNSMNSSQSILNRNSAHYSPIDTLLQTVENERMQQLAMEDEAINLINNVKKMTNLKSANVSDLDLVAQNEDDTFDKQDEIVKSSLIINNENEKNNELVNQTLLKTIKCTNSQLIQNNIKVINDNSIKKITTAINNCNSSSVIKNGQIALLQDSVAKNSLTVDCNLTIDNSKNNNPIDLQTKQQQLVQTAQQALVTLASTASNLCKSNTTTVTIQSPNKISQSSNDNSNLKNEKSNSIQNNSKVEKNDLSISKSANQSQQNNGLLMAASNIMQQPKMNDNEQLNQQQSKNQPFNYLVSHSGRTIKPTAAAKSYVQRKHRLNTKYMRTHNSPTNSTATVNKKQSSINKTKMNNSNLMQFERLLEAAQSNSNYNQNKNINDLNMVRNTIISSVGNLNNNNSSNNTINNHTTNEIQQVQIQQQQQQLQQQPDTQRTPTGRIRNTGAKCRKRFGMENKHQWCVSCRWKKRCSRVVDSNSGLTNLTEYNNQAGTTNTTERVGRGRPGRSANTSSNNSDQRRANVTSAISSTRADNHSQRNNLISTNATGSDFSAMAEELLRTGTLLNNQRTIVTAK